MDICLFLDEFLKENSLEDIRTCSPQASIFWSQGKVNLESNISTSKNFLVS